MPTSPALRAPALALPVGPGTLGPARAACHNPSRARLSVVMPVRDRAALVAEALETVCAQTRRADEVIVVDDGSRDATPAVLAGYGAALTVLRTEGAGPAHARNVGVAAASGAYIAFLDSDDLWAPRALEHLAAALDAGGADVAWGLCRTQVLPGGALPAASWPTGPARLVNLGTMLFRADALRRVGGFDAALHFGEDCDLWMRARAAGLAIAPVDEAVLTYRRHAGNMTNEQGRSGRAFLDVARAAMLRRRAAAVPRAA